MAGARTLPGYFPPSAPADRLDPVVYRPSAVPKFEVITTLDIPCSSTIREEPLCS